MLYIGACFGPRHASPPPRERVPLAAAARECRRRGLKVCSVVLSGCSKGSQLQLDLVWELPAQLARGGLASAPDRRGVPSDAVWRMRVAALPDRFVRLYGSAALLALFTKYSFSDASGCAYNLRPDEIARDNGAAVISRLESEAERRSFSAKLGAGTARAKPVALLCSARDVFDERPDCHIAALNVGIPQTSSSSGICWWGSLWFALCYNAQTFKVTQAYFTGAPRSAAGAEMHQLLPRMLRDARAAHRMRQLLFSEFGVGDDPEQDPRLDGQNGYAQLVLLCSKLGAPLITLVQDELGRRLEPGAALPVPKNARREQSPAPRAPAPLEPVLLGVRTYRSRLQPPMRLSWRGESWLLRSALVGSEFCGHQVAIAAGDESRRWWAAYDADGVRLGIGPVSWQLGAEFGSASRAADVWWRSLGQMLPVTNEGDGSIYCDLNPQNRHPFEAVIRAHEAARAGRATQGELAGAVTPLRLVNVDWIYTRASPPARPRR